MIEWPTVVASRFVEDLADRVAARRGRVWVLQGPAGIGKSTVVSAVAPALRERGIEVLTVAADPALAAVPLGAFLPLLSASDADGAPESQLAHLFRRLSKASANAALIVEDAPALDERSAATVHQLVKVYGVRCLVTARPSHRLDPALLRLDDEGHVERIEIAPLDEATAAAVVETALGAPASSDSLLALIHRTGGNPLMLRMLLAAAERASLITPSPRGLVIGAPPLPRRIAELLTEPLEALPERAAVILQLLCVADGLPAELVDADAADAAAVAELERIGLIRRASADRQPGGRLLPAAPALAETVVGLLGPAELDRRRIEAARRLAALRDDDHRFAGIVLLAETSEPPSVDDLAWAARIATAQHRYALAIALAERADARAEALGAPRPVEALVLRGESLSLLGRLDDADRAFEVATAVDGDDAGIALAAARASSHWAIRRNDPQRAAQTGVAALARLTDRGARAFLEANIAKWQIMVGAETAVPDDSDSTDPVTGSDSAVAAAALDTNLYRVVAAVLGGDVDGARAAIAAGRPHAADAQPIVRHGEELFDFSEALMLAIDGRLGEALSTIQPRLLDRFAEGAGMWSYGAALLLLHTGRVEEAHHHAAAAVEQLAWRDFLGARGAAIALHATTSALLGDDERADRILRELDTTLRSVVNADLQAAEAEALLRTRAGDPHAVDPIERAVSAAVASGYAGWIAFTAATAVRLGRPNAVIDALRAARVRSSAALLRMVHDHAEALIAGDPAGLLDAATALESAGMLGAAHDAARQALGLARADGGGGLARRASILVSRTAAGLSPAPRGSDHAAVLTPREWDVAIAAAARERNREIAQRLGLSLRTVENHLASVYRKLGVAGRDELREQLV